jgi:hypothetical protein
MAVTSVFISSTSSDLKEYRATVRESLLNAGYHPIDMADFMARSQGARTACLDEVAEADYFVGIYAWRYGFIPQGSEVSITEQEYDEALRLEKPRFCFFVEEGYAWPNQFQEGGDGGEKMKKFKAKLDATIVRTTFTTPDSLAKKVLSTLARHEKEEHKKTFQVAAKLFEGITSVEEVQNLIAGVLDNSEVPYQVDQDTGAFRIPQGSTILEVNVSWSDELGGMVNFRAILEENVDIAKVPADLFANLLAFNHSRDLGAITFEPESGRMWYKYSIPANILRDEVTYQIMSYVASQADQLDDELSQLLPNRPKRKGKKK